MPLIRRVPKRGFVNGAFRKDYATFAIPQRSRTARSTRPPSGPPASKGRRGVIDEASTLTSTPTSPKGLKKSRAGGRAIVIESSFVLGDGRDDPICLLALGDDPSSEEGRSADPIGRSPRSPAAGGWPSEPSVV